MIECIIIFGMKEMFGTQKPNREDSGKKSRTEICLLISREHFFF